MRLRPLQHLDGSDFLIQVMPECCAVQPDTEAGIPARMGELVRQPSPMLIDRIPGRVNGSGIQWSQRVQSIQDRVKPLEAVDCRLHVNG